MINRRLVLKCLCCRRWCAAKHSLRAAAKEQGQEGRDWSLPVSGVLGSHPCENGPEKGVSVDVLNPADWQSIEQMLLV